MVSRLPAWWLVRQSYPVVRGAPWTGAAAAAGVTAGALTGAGAAPGRAALGAAPGGTTLGAPGTTGCSGGVTGASAHAASSLVSFGLPGPASSPPAPRNLDPVWQFECTSPLASGSGDGVAEAAVTQPIGAASVAANTRLTSAFLIGGLPSVWRHCHSARHPPFQHWENVGQRTNRAKTRAALPHGSQVLPGLRARPPLGA